MPKNKSKVFVAMPYGIKSGVFDHANYNKIEKINFEEVWEFIIQPALESDFEFKRSDELKKPGIIDKNYIEWLLDADVVVADLTFGNPNVCYELGIRHTLVKKGTVLIAHIEADLPFDLRNQYVLRYDKDDTSKLLSFHKDLKHAIDQAIINDMDSPVHIFIPDLYVGLNENVPQVEIEKLKSEIDDLKSQNQLLHQAWESNQLVPRIERSFKEATNSRNTGSLIALYRSITKKEVSFEVLLMFGTYLRQVDKLDEALALLKRAERLDDLDFSLLRELGFTYRLIGPEHYHNAMKYFSKALSVNDEDTELQGMMGGLLKREGRYKEAREHYAKAYSLDHYDLYAVMGMAAISFVLDYQKDSEKYYDKAIQLCRQAIHSKKDSYWTYLNLGEAYFAKGDIDRSSGLYKDALEYNPPVNDVRSAADQLNFLSEHGLNPYDAKNLLSDLLNPYIY